MRRGSIAGSMLALALAAGCGSNQAAVPSFADNAGVLGCADLVAWGTVMSAKTVDTGLAVTLDVRQWVHPASGDREVTVLADDPAKEVGAPRWQPSSERILVIVSDLAPTQYYTVSDGEQAVAQWRDAGSPRLSKEQCARA